MLDTFAVRAAELIGIGALALQAASVGIVLFRFARPGPVSATTGLPPMSLLRPVCGIENFVEETLASSFALDYPTYEVVFCVADAADPVVPLVERLMAANTSVPARLLVGDDPISANPKLNNLAKGWAVARHDWIVMADSNLLLPPDYLAILLARWTPGTGLVSSPPAGVRPAGFWGELECAFLDSYQARWQLAADEIGNGFAQGKTLFWRRDILDAAGGPAALGAEMAEDLASTKLVRGAGLKVRLVQRPFAQPIGSREFAEVWRRQLRWSRYRRMGFPGYFAAEILTGSFLPLLLGLALVAAGTLAPWVLVALAVAWYLAEAWLARAAGWPVSVRAAVAWLVRDLLLPLLWLVAWTGSGFAWRGNRMAVGAVPTRLGAD
ncbi:MAG: ceramide glucosyltransferase [Amaricoccus sp.]